MKKSQESLEMKPYVLEVSTNVMYPKKITLQGVAYDTYDHKQGFSIVGVDDADDFKKKCDEIAESIKETFPEEDRANVVVVTDIVARKFLNWTFEEVENDNDA